MKAHSTNRTYESWDDLVTAEANGYSVVVMMQRTSAKSGRTQHYSRVFGPFPDRKAARNRAAAARRRWKHAQDRYPDAQLLGVSVECIWADLRFDAGD